MGRRASLGSGSGVGRSLGLWVSSRVKMEGLTRTALPHVLLQGGCVGAWRCACPSPVGSRTQHRVHTSGTPRQRARDGHGLSQRSGDGHVVPGVVWQAQRKDREQLVVVIQGSTLTTLTPISDGLHRACRREGGRQCEVCRQTHQWNWSAETQEGRRVCASTHDACVVSREVCGHDAVGSGWWHSQHMLM